MARYDVEKLARDIVNIEKKHSALSLTTQLPNSSVRLSTGEEGDVAAGIEDGTDALANSETLYDYADEIGDLNDEDIDYGATIPDWILNAGSVGDTAWELADINNEAVTEALENADQAAADALAASQAAADAAVKAQEAMDALERSVVGTVIEYSVSESDTVPPSEGWSADNPEPAEGEFVWMRTVITYADETTSTSMPVLMSRGGSGVSVESIRPFYALTPDTPPVTVPSLPTTLEPSPPWMPAPPVFVSGMILVVTDRIVYSDGSFTYMPARTVPDWKAAGEALAEAEAARFLAEGIYQVIPSVTEPTQAPNGSELKQGDQWWVIGAEETEQAGKFVGVKVYDGAQWIDRQIVADSVLVPGSVGPILLEDGAVSAPKLAADAIDGMTITGALVRTAETGQRFELDVSGLRGYNSNGDIVATLKPTGAGLSLVRGAYEAVSADNTALAWLNPSGVGGYALDSGTITHAFSLATYPDRIRLISNGVPLDLEAGTAAGSEASKPIRLWNKAELHGNVFQSVLGYDGLYAWDSAPSGTRAWVTAENREYVRIGGQWVPVDNGHLLIKPDTVTQTTTPQTVTGNATWANAKAIGPIVLSDVKVPQWIKITFGGICKGTTGYVMLGVRLTGATDISEQTWARPGGVDYFGAHTPFINSTTDASISGFKLVRINPGTTTVRLRQRRSVGSGTHHANYTSMMVEPVSLDL